MNYNAMMCMTHMAMLCIFDDVTSLRCFVTVSLSGLKWEVNIIEISEKWVITKHWLQKLTTKNMLNNHKNILTIDFGTRGKSEIL